MRAVLRDINFESESMIEVFDSLIWTERYSVAGDFELVGPTSILIVDPIDGGQYLELVGSDRLMVVEEMKIESNPVDGDRVIAKGRSIETVLDRRIIWDRTEVKGNLQDGILKLLTENAINPADPARKISRLIFEASTDPIITALEIDKTYFGESLYTVIQELCSFYKIGFKMVLTSDHKLKFSLYSGADRSYAQSANPYIVFSPEMGNVKKVEYVVSNTGFKTVALVAGEVIDEEAQQINVPLPDGPGVELERREMFFSSSEVLEMVPGGKITSAAYLEALSINGQEYLDRLQLIGLQELYYRTDTKIFESEIDTEQTTYQYGTDFFMGDLVQVLDNYGHGAQSRVTEFIRSEDNGVINVYPTFATER